MNRLFVTVIRTAGVVLLAMLAGACSRPRAESAAAGGVVTVAAVKATRGDVRRTVNVTAAFRAFQEIDVHAKVAGYLKSIGVDVGDRVQAGQLLAVLEVPELQADLDQEEAGVKRSEEEVNRAQADLERATSAHEVAHLSAERLASVLKVRPNLVAQQDIDEGTGRDRVAEAQVATARAAVAAAQEQLVMARAGESRTQTLVGYTQITAPFPGVITQRYADTGAMIQAGTSSQTQAMPIVRLSENARLRLVIPVPESAVSHIHVGEPVELKVSALDKTFTGTVARFANRLDAETRTMRVEVDVHNPSLELVPGMYAEATIVLDASKNVIVAPVEAIDRTAQTPRAFIVNSDHRLELREVTLGLDAGDQVEITAGVRQDDLLVIGNRSQLKPGVIVTPRLTEAPAAAEEAH